MRIISTTYDSIYEAGIKRFRDYNYLAYSADTKSEIMLGLLRSSAADFEEACQYDLTKYDDIARQFTATFGAKEIEILGLGIAYYWCSEQTLNSELFKNIPSTKEFAYSSPATLLTSIQNLRDSLKKELKQEIINYGYTHGDIASLKV